MNKNWLYRILAIALVAMLALPMFAMAEEAAIELGAEGEATAAEAKLGVDWNLDGDWFDIDAANLEEPFVWMNATANNSYTLTVDMATDWLDYQVDTGDTSMDSLKCTKNTKKAVLTCDKHNHITIKKPGKAVLTFKTTSALTGQKVTLKLTVKVKDSSKLVLKKESNGDELGKVWSIALGAPFTKRTLDVSGWTVNDSTSISTSAAELGESAVLALRADMEVTDDPNSPYEDIDYVVGEEPDESRISQDIAHEINNGTHSVYRLATYKSSNKAVVAVNPFSGELFAKKTGTSTVTCTLYGVNDRDDAYPIKTAKVKIKVVKNKSAVNPNMKLALAAAKADEDFYFGVKQAEYTKIKMANGVPYEAKLKVTYFVANGTDNKIKSIWDPAATLSYIRFDNASQNSFGAMQAVFASDAFAQVLVDGNDKAIKSGKFSVNWKPGKISTFTKEYTLDLSEYPLVDLTDTKAALAVTEFTFSTRPNGEETYQWKAAE